MGSNPPLNGYFNGKIIELNDGFSRKPMFEYPKVFSGNIRPYFFFLQSSVSELPISVDEFHASEIDLT